MMATLSKFQTEYNVLLETCDQLAEEREHIEAIISTSTRLENLDDLELAEQYLTSLSENQEVLKLLKCDW